MSAYIPRMFNPPDVHPPRPTYSHVCVTPISTEMSLVTIAGQIGMTQTGDVPPGFADQVAVAQENLAKCLQAAGAGLSNIIKITHFIVNHDPADRTRPELYMKFMGQHRPPSTLVGVAKLADANLLYEIEALAIVHSSASHPAQPA